MRGKLGLTWILAGLTATAALAQGRSPMAHGVVFHDANRNGVRDPGEAGLPGVRVSNGREIVRTDENGLYYIRAEENGSIFVIKPRGWMTPVDEHNLPRFYYLYKPKGSPPGLKYPGVPPTGPLPESIDFPLFPQEEPDRFDVLVFGDTQPYEIRDVEFLAHDIVEQVAGTQAAFCLSLGDLVFDKLDLFPQRNGVMARIGVPVYNVLGNHDMNYAAADDTHSTETFQRYFGPPYYAFDYGPVHFIVLDDIVWHGATKEKRGGYKAGLGDRQLEFLRNDLMLVPQQQLVVVSMHIPIVEVAERKEVYELLSKLSHVISFSAHTHVFESLFLDESDGWPGAVPHHHINFGTTCGSWWQGAPDEYGIPHAMMQDGTPNGWYVVTFEGNRYRFRFFPARRPADFQMSIYTPESIRAKQVGDTEVVVNVFAGSSRSRVEMRVDGGPWTGMNWSPRKDPFFLALKALENSDQPPRGRKLARPVECRHIWVGKLPADLKPGTHRVEVRTTDMFGRIDTACRVFRVE